MLSLHDTALGRVTEIVTRDEGKLAMYVCGPTVYDVPHLGHGRSALVYDVLRRWLEARGTRVRHVSNVTDVDDKIIQRAAEERRSAGEVAEENEQVWWDAMDRLGVLRPTVAPRATEYVAQMIEAVAKMVEKEQAYSTDFGVYFASETVADYGLLARQSLRSLKIGARVERDPTKRSPVDFVLWKRAKPGEPAWSSPWGSGRPGWHTECVVMSLDLLGDGFDLHSGGLDLQFPHHENERAQAAALGRPFARHWVHHAFVELAGEKMSKSSGNYTSLVDLLDSADERAFRLLVLQSHYRSPLEVTAETIAAAESSLDRLDAMARRLGAGDGLALAPVRLAASSAEPMSRGGVDIVKYVERFNSRMEDDLDTPAAISEVFDLVRAANAAAEAGEVVRASSMASAASSLLASVGLMLKAAGGEVDAISEDLLARREAARREKDFALADSLRDELLARGWIVEDLPTGSKLRRSHQ